MLNIFKKEKNTERYEEITSKEIQEMNELLAQSKSLLDLVLSGMEIRA